MTESNGMLPQACTISLYEKRVQLRVGFALALRILHPPTKHLWKGKLANHGTTGKA